MAGLIWALLISCAPLAFADVGLLQVATPAELKQAIIAGASEIVFVANITLDEATFPGALRSVHCNTWHAIGLRVSTHGNKVRIKCDMLWM